MRVNLSGHHVAITPALRSYVERKFARVARHFDRLIDLQCILTVEKLRHKAESTIQVRGSRIYADAVEDDMYAAIDALADKLDRRVRKHKEKRGNHYALPTRRNGLAASP